MDAPAYVPDYAFDVAPAPGDTTEVAPGVHWLRMPLPFKLDHINLWLLDDGDGWTIVDTGIARDEVKDAWERIFEAKFRGKPLKRVIVTHFHPDHLGLAGWLIERFGVPFWMTREEWSWGRMLSLETNATLKDGFRRFYGAAGFTGEMLETAEKRAGRYGTIVSPIPASFVRMEDGDEIDIGGRGWRVIVGTGHAPEHACLHCAELGVLISGDQVLPKISPNISVWPQEPDADPLSQFLDSIDKFRGLPASVLVLPSHNRPFRGLHGRLDDLAAHHAERLEETLAACRQPVSGLDVLGALFKRELDSHQVMFAIGESLAHLHHLMAVGRIARRMGDDGVYLFESV